MVGTGRTTNPKSEIEKLEKRYGELAPQYAEAREEAARDLGENERADRWGEIETALRARDED